MVTAVDGVTTPGSSLVTNPSIRDQAAQVASSGDMASAQAFLAEHPAASSVLEDELVRAGQFSLIHQLSNAGTPQTVAQAQSVESDAPLSIPAPGGRQFHENEIAVIQQSAPGFARLLTAQTKQHFSTADAERILAQAAYARINPGAPPPEQPQFKFQALDYLDAHSPHTLLDADASVPGAEQAFYFSSTPAQRTDSRIYASTLQSHAAFYQDNGLLRDPEGTAQRAAEFDAKMANAQAWTAAAPGIAASLVLAPIAPTVVGNARYYVLAHPLAAIEGTDLVGGFLLGDAMPNGLGLSLGPMAGAAIAARTDGTLIQRVVRGLSDLFNTPARESAQRIQQSIAKAVTAGEQQRQLEIAAGNLKQDIASITTGPLGRDITKAAGRIGEATVKAFVENQGYEVLGRVANKSGNGIDLVARAKDGRLMVIEVKATTKGERTAEAGLQKFGDVNTDRILQGTNQAKGTYAEANLTEDSQRALEALRTAKAGSIDFRWAVVYLDENRSVQGVVMDRWAQSARP